MSTSQVHTSYFLKPTRGMGSFEEQRGGEKHQLLNHKSLDVGDC